MRCALVVVVLVSVAACKKNEVQGSAVAPPTATVTQLSPSAGGELKGKVLERIDAPNYTYLRVGQGSAQAWAAVPTSPVAVGAEVTLTGATPMQGFESKTLNRKWDLIYFAQGVGVAGEKAAGTEAPHAQPPSLPAGGPSATPVDLSNIKVEKAAGQNARTVSEVWTQKGALKDKTVSVRGKVVKYTPGVMGKNWLHLRDGSGSDSAKDNDITVVTGETTTLNEVITVVGVVHTDKDLGSGYAYPVIIEDASVSK